MTSFNGSQILDTCIIPKQLKYIYIFLGGIFPLVAMLIEIEKGKETSEAGASKKKTSSRKCKYIYVKPSKKYISVHFCTSLGRPAR